MVNLIPQRHVGPRAFLALPIGVCGFLVTFTVIAHFVSAYAFTVPLTFLVLWFLLARHRQQPAPTEGSQCDSRWQSVFSFGVFFLVAGATLSLHSLWPDLHWENTGDKAGVEKLFNLSMHQSFLFGAGYPPEWIWASGEVSRYYMLPKILPGLASWLGRVVFGDPMTGGVQYLLSEAVLVGLSSGAVSAWVMLLLGALAPSSSVRHRIAVGVVLGLLVFVDSHGFALVHGLSQLIAGNEIDWWVLQKEIVQYTENQYPMWLIMLGDNHAYAQVIPFQITLWGTVFLLLLEKKLCLRLTTLVAFGAAAVFLSHVPSVLLNMVTLVPAAVCAICWEASRRNRPRVYALVGNFGVAAIGAALLIALNSKITGNTKHVFPPPEVVSPVLQFLSVQLWPLTWIALVATLTMAGGALTTVAFRRAWQLSYPTKAEAPLECISALAAWCLVICLYAERPAIAVAILLGIFFFVLILAARIAVEPDVHRSIAVFCGWVFGVWILPELLAIDNLEDNRILWIRFNMVLRFWPEGYYLIPFVVTIGLGASLLEALRSRGIATIFYGASALLFVLFSLAHIPAIQNRERRAETQQSIDGFRFVARETTYDAQIIEFLSHLPSTPRVVIAESCGTESYPAIPQSYSWPGRISAFSGRLAVCGWSRHAELHQPELQNSVGSEVLMRERNFRFHTALLRILSESGASLPGLLGGRALNREGKEISIAEATAILRTFGVTHLVFGEREEMVYGGVVLDQLAAVVRGQVVFRSSKANLGVIKVP